MAAPPGRRPHSPRRAPPSTTVGRVNATESPETDIQQESIETIAAAWLAAEQELAGGSGNPEHSEMKARDLSARYDEAIRSATREELRLAWEAARKIQA